MNENLFTTYRPTPPWNFQSLIVVASHQSSAGLKSRKKKHIRDLIIFQFVPYINLEPGV